MSERPTEPTRRGLLRAAAETAALGAAVAAGATSLQAAEAPGRRAPPSSGRIIDIHSHALLPIWLDAARKASGQTKDQFRIAGAPVPDWSVDLHLEMMAANGIAASVLSWPSATVFLTGPAARDLARAMNEEFAAIIRRHPTRFSAFAVLPLDDMDAAVEELAYAMDVLKLDGASSSTHVRGAYLGHPRYDPLFAELDRRGATLFVHPTPPVGYDQVDLGLNPAILEFMFDSTRMVTNMVLSGAKARFPRMRVISTHGGGTIPYLASRISILEPQFGAGAARPTLSADQVLKQLATFYFDLTASTAAASLDAIRRLVPASQLMLGFDFPMMPATSVAPALGRFAAYRDLSAGDRRQIMDGAALQLLPQLARRLA
jgi:predicted TIM-barrel fold metal-dependent hydrolase